MAYAMAAGSWWCYPEGMNKHTKPAINDLLHRVETSYPVGERKWHKRALAGCAGMLLGLAMAPAMAQSNTPPTQNMTAHSTKAPFVELGALESKAHEGKTHFLLRVAHTMDYYTSTTGREACGVVMVNDDNTKWRVRLLANDVHMGCVHLRFDEPGFYNGGQTIHSHFVQGKLDPSDIAGVQAQEFVHGPGYLVLGGVLVEFQHQSLPIHILGTIDRLAGVDVPVMGGYRGVPQIEAQLQDQMLEQMAQDSGKTQQRRMGR
jgi:hypothetical protein